MTVNNELINRLTDLLDYASLLYYDEKENTYLECLSKIIQAYLEDVPLNLEDETMEKLQSTFKEIQKIKANPEELRQVFLLLSIKGFKHANFSLDIITPDATSLICSYLIESFIKGLDVPCDLHRLYQRPLKGKYQLLDINYGVGNLSLVINNNLPKPLKITGIESSNVLANYANSINNFMNLEATIYNQDALSLNVKNADIIIGDLATYEYDNIGYTSYLVENGVTYFPYLAIEKHLESGHEKTKYLYLIDYDFFEQQGSQIFKKVLQEKVMIKSLIVLPATFFQTEPKAILILDKVRKGSTNIVTLPNLSKKDEFYNVLKNIKKQLEE